MLAVQCFHFRSAFPQHAIGQQNQSITFCCLISAIEELTKKFLEFPSLKFVEVTPDVFT
jgi:hypothetical protein